VPRLSGPAAAFREHLRTNNTGGLDVVWARASPDDRRAIVEALHALDGSPSEAHLLLRALVPSSAPFAEQERFVALGIEALSDLASRGSSDRQLRLAQWAKAGEVREALLATAAQVGASSSNELVEWLACSEDDALLDALIPVFLGAVDARDGTRLELLTRVTAGSTRLASVKARYDELKRRSRDEWLTFVRALGLDHAPPFTATCSWRAEGPSIGAVIDPRKLDWYRVTWGAHAFSSTRSGDAAAPIDASLPLRDVPKAVLGAMRAARLRGRTRVETSGSDEVRARLTTWFTSGA
jgi:hypothetical protein